MYLEKKTTNRVYVLNDEDRDRLDGMILALRIALDAVFDRRKADLGNGTAGLTEFDQLVDQALWAYLDAPDPDL